jgi:D-amino-acid dehydrogenase
MPIIDDTRLFGLVPLGDRLRVSGSAEITGYDTEPAPARCKAIIDNVIRAFPKFADCYEPEKAVYWAGLRPVTPTGTPCLGRTRFDNLLVNAGHGHLGWTMSCGSGKVLADVVAKRPLAGELANLNLTVP